MTLNDESGSHADRRLDDEPLEYVADRLDIGTLGAERRTITDPNAGADLVEAHVRDRLSALMSRFPGRPTVLLSGGVDSVLVAAAAQSLGSNPLAVTVATADSLDATAAAAAATALGLDHQIVWLDDATTSALAEQAIKALGIEELWEVTAAIPLVAAHPFFTAGPILPGSGADAIFGGGRSLSHPVDSPEATVELDELIRAETAANFRRERLVPHFYEALLDNDANRFVHVYQTEQMWLLSEKLSAAALFTDSDNGQRYDKSALRIACSRLLPDKDRDLAWTAKDPIQRSSGIMSSLLRAARDYAADLPGATTYSHPAVEPAELLATRLYLAGLGLTSK